MLFLFCLWVSRDEVCAREVLPSSTLLLRMSISCKISGGSIDDLKTNDALKDLGFCFIEDGDDRTLWIASLTPPLRADVPEFAGDGEMTMRRAVKTTEKRY